MCACLMQSCGSMSICDFKPPVSQLSFLGMNENQPKTLTSGWNSPCCSATLLMGAVGVSAIWMPDRIGWYKSLYQIKCHKLRLTAADCTVKLDRCSEMTWNHRTGCTLWNHHWVLSRANYCCKVQLISLSYMHTYNKMIHSLYIKLIQKSMLQNLNCTFLNIFESSNILQLPLGVVISHCRNCDNNMMICQNWQNVQQSRHDVCAFFVIYALLNLELNSRDYNHIWPHLLP